MTLHAILFGQPSEGERGLYWNSWELVHPEPSVLFEPDKNALKKGIGSELYAYGVASVDYGGIIKSISAKYRRDLDHEILSIDKFCAKFPKGRRLWNASITFWRRPRHDDWTFFEVCCHGVPLSSNPPMIIGFLEDYSAKDRGATDGLGKFEMIARRSRAGLPDGPKNAADF